MLRKLEEMKEDMPRKYQLAMLAFAVLLVAGAVWFGYHQGKQSTTQHAINPRLEEIQDSMALRAAIKLELEKVYQDSMTEHKQRLADALTDTTRTSEINKRYDETTATNWNLSNDSAARLYRARLNTEEDYRKRFVYVLD